MGAGVMVVAEWLLECSREFVARIDELDELDRALGDGDHGTNMVRGFAAAENLDLSAQLHAAEALRQVGMALVQNVGGASGPLFGTFFLRAGAHWDPSLTTPGLALALREALRGVQARGKAEPGDKTMIDALAPASASLDASAAEGENVADALEKAAAAAEAGRDATVDMVARRGRAALNADRSVGIIDPGAVSMALILRTAVHHIG
ncbi:dihydroxyacetone kinase subunit L [Tessaracoccus sp. MC1865]|nr:dihydroxyacetone kinase subunit DhaL [Tessaracoccus sp. MC1865]QTO36906.1 dihydroxyacetone kinase subunit L [Tessaracoccus sp. MC1865]